MLTVLGVWEPKPALLSGGWQGYHRGQNKDKTGTGQAGFVARQIEPSLALFLTTHGD